MTFLQELLSNILMANLHLIILSVFLSSVILLSIFILLRFRAKKIKKITPTPTVQLPVQQSTPITVTSQDIRAIAGEDMMATQLDLARAYIEMGKKKLARKILNHVVENGDSTQQEQANRLIVTIEAS